MYNIKENKINAATILQVLAGLLQHALILFYCTPLNAVHFNNVRSAQHSDVCQQTLHFQNNCDNSWSVAVCRLRHVGD